MTIEEERAAASRDRKRAAQRTVNAYKTIFAGPDGKTVLDDMISVFGFRAPSFIPTATGPNQPLSYDSHYAAVRSGQHSVYLHILAKLDAPATGDANITEGDKVLTGLSQ
jgi:hypothetical protein